MSDNPSKTDTTNLESTHNFSENRSLQVLSNLRNFGEYELLHEISHGGMGVVYMARQLALDRIVALKMIRAGQLANDEEISRFRTEARATARLDHPGIVSIYEVGDHCGQHYYTMAFMEGGSLNDRLRDGPLPPLAATDIVCQIAVAIQFAHENGIVHRDLKPSNVLVDRSGQPKIADFGLAKCLAEDSVHTLSGTVVGTPGYMSPEQATGHLSKIGPLSDVYSLGAVLYCLVTGRPPFAAATHIDTLKQVLHDLPVPPRMLNRAIPKDLETICLKCLEKDPAKRFHSAEEFAEELKLVLSGFPIKSQPVSALAKFWRWYLRNPMAARITAGVYAALLGTVLSLWAAMGLVYLAVGLYKTETKIRCFVELTAVLTFLWIPLVVCGVCSLSGRRSSLWVALFLFSIYSYFCILATIGLEGSFLSLEINREVGLVANVRLQYFTLTSIAAIIGVVCHVAAVASLRLQEDKSD